MGNNIQLEISFEKPINHFRKNMESGTFCVLFETPAPPKNEDISAASNFLASMENAVFSNSPIETGLAITDKVRAEECHDPADFANWLKPDSKGSTLIFISGKNLKRDQLDDKLARCKSSGFSNIVCVTGDLGLPNISNAASSRTKFIESIHMISRIAEMKDNEIFQGAVTNPFIYCPSGTYPQYYGLVKKIRKGANFIISQAGWDMAKIQELKWFLETRELHTPVISRIYLLSPELVEDIVAGKKPGIYMSADMGKILRKEFKFGFAQFLSAQWRRIQFKAAGAKLMGCSGVMISGLERPEHVQTICQKIKEALDEFRTFEDWKDAYINYLSKADMAPYPKRFYMYENLFTRQHPEIKRAAEVKDCNCTRKEKLVYRLCKMIFKKANLKFSGEHYFSKKILVNCKSCSYCRLPLTQYVCPETCPKGMSNGPCAGVKIDASCEALPMECIHSKRFRIAMWRNELDTMEERFIRSTI